MDEVPWVCQQCRLHDYPDCLYRFHPRPPRPDDDHWRDGAEEAGRSALRDEDYVWRKGETL